MIYYLSIGSNSGDREYNIKSAIRFLDHIGRIIKTSSVYETSPIDMKKGSRNFFNLVLSIKTHLSPDLLLKKIKFFEHKQGRDLQHSHLQPRLIDIDILWADTLIQTTNLLTIPHPQLTKRAFVLIPLAEIDPKLIPPGQPKTIAELVAKLSSHPTIPGRMCRVINADQLFEMNNRLD